MKRKLIALLMAMMIIASGISAFAIDADGTFSTDDIAIINDAVARLYPDAQEMVGYVIRDGGLWMLMNTTTYAINPAINADNYPDELWKDYDATHSEAALQAFLAKWVVATKSAEPEVVPVDADFVVGKDEASILAEYPGYHIAYRFTNSAGDTTDLLLFNGKKYVVVSLNVSTTTPDVDGQPTTGTDIFELDYSSFYGDVISAFAFKPEAFGNGIEFSHKNAKSLFTMTVKYDSRIVIQLRDQQGRLYPVSGATYQAADNGYVTTMKADESKTFGWYGTDGAGYHAAGSLKDPAIIELDLNVKATTTGKNADGTPWATDRGDMRFSYTVRHGEDNHTGNYSGNSGSSSPKTGDARMAYLTLASLVVLAGVAVIITRKLRTNA